MEDWKVNYVESLNRKRGDISKARGACTEEQLRVLDRLVKVVEAFEFDFTEIVCNGGSANDIRVGSFTDLFDALGGYRAQWAQDHTPDFYDEVMDYKRWQSAQEVQEEVRGFNELVSDLDDLIDSVKPKTKKKCVSCSKKLKGRQTKFCSRKCKDKHYAKK